MHPDMIVVRDGIAVGVNDARPVGDDEEVYSYCPPDLGGYAIYAHAGGLIAVWPDGHVTALPAIPPTGKSPAAILGRQGGSARSERKAQTSRENGKLGGRPRKSSPTATGDGQS